MASFKKTEILSGKTRIERLFREGSVLNRYPFKIYYHTRNNKNNEPVCALFAIPKKNFKRAVDRNLLRRRIKEIYRNKKDDFYKDLIHEEKYIDLIFIYISPVILKNNMIEKSLQQAFKAILKNLTKDA